MKFTQRHYQVVADVINDAMNNMGTSNTDSKFLGGKVAGIEEVANSLADTFQKDNPRFRRDLFMKACDLE